MEDPAAVRFKDRQPPTATEEVLTLARQALGAVLLLVRLPAAEGGPLLGIPTQIPPVSHHVVL